MYFRDRRQAGLKLADIILRRYRGRNTAVLALSEGSLLVGDEIARVTHSSLSILLTQDIKIPGETVALGEIDALGTFTYNRMYSTGQLEAFNQEFINHIEQEKRQKLHEIHRIIGRGGFVRPDILRNHVVIIVSDGANSGLAYDVALSYLKPIRTQLVVAAAPIASINAVDRLHVSFDDIAFVSVAENFLETDHYYDNNDMPTRDEVLELIEKAPLKWIHPHGPNKSET